MLKSKTALSLLTAIALALTSCQGGGKQNSLLPEELPLPEQVNYAAVQVESGRFIKTSQGSASVIYPVSANLFWEDSGARFEQILVSSGDRVKKGDVLAVFEIESSHAQLSELKLQLSRKKEALREGSEERLRDVQAAERKVRGNVSYERQIAREELEKAQVDYEQFIYETEREIAKLEKSIAAMEETIQNNTLTAPFDGVIGSVAVYHPGDRVTAGETIISMYSTERFLLRVGESPDKLRYNMSLTVEAGRKNERKTFQGRVLAEPGILPPAVSMDYALIQLEEGVSIDDLKYSIQYTCVSQEAYNALLVDRRAVQKENGKDYVYLLEDDMAKKRFVEVGSSNLESTWILDGLSQGQTLILD